MIELFWHSAVDSLLCLWSLLSSQLPNTQCLLYWIKKKKKRSYRFKDSCPMPSSKCTGSRKFVWISLLGVGDSVTIGHHALFHISNKQHVQLLVGHCLSLTRTWFQIKTLNTVRFLFKFWQEWWTTTRALFSSDYSTWMDLFCQTFSLQYRSNNCYIIPVTQWQCICFLSLN